MRAAAVAVIALALAGCQNEAPSPSSTTSAPSVASAPNAVVGARIEFVDAPEGGDVAAIVQRERVKAKEAGRELIVYVGASWCEPCTRFHDAALAGRLDGALPALRLVAFDLDRDRERLAQAGYASKLIPLLALPRADGQASRHRIEGGYKRADAAEEIAGRLGQLLAKAKQEGEG